MRSSAGVWPSVASGSASRPSPVPARIHHLACYYQTLNQAAEARGEKFPGRVSREVDAISENLVRTVAAVRVPSVLRPLHALIRRWHRVGGLLVSDEDLRILLADYSPTPNLPR